MKERYLLAALCALGLASCEKRSPTPSADAAAPGAVASDNTGVNTRDRAADAKTAGMAGQGKGDVDLAAEIRKRIVDTKMSVDAQNAKVVVQGGKVTLRGPVKSEEEKQALAKIATDVAGAGNVDNQLEIAGAAAPSP